MGQQSAFTGKANLGRLKILPLSISMIICSLWTGISLAAFLFYWFIHLDENVSRFQTIFIIGIFVLFDLFSLIVLRFIRNCKTLLAAFFISLFVSFSVFALLPNLFFPVQMIKEFSFEEISLDKNAKLEVAWTYWADFPENSDVSFYEPLKDISFSAFEATGDWKKTETGALSVTEEKSSFVFKNTGLHTKMPVIAVRTVNGEGIIEVNQNGDKHFEALKGSPDEQLLIAPINQKTSEIPQKIILILMMSGILFIPMILCCYVFSLLFRPGTKLRRVFVRIYQYLYGKHIDLSFYLLSFFIPVVLILIVWFFSEMVPFGDNLLLINDNWEQYSKFLAYFREAGLNKDTIFYTFSGGLGSNFYGNFIYYLSSPLNLILFLFPIEKINVGYLLVTLIRFGLSGLFSGVFFYNHSNRSFSSILFSTSYALMGYAVVNSEASIFLDGIEMLPLVAFGIEKLVRDKKPTVYIAMLALLLMKNFYMGYMVCIFSVLFFFWNYLNLNVSFGKEGRKIIAQFFLSSILSAGLAAFSLIPISSVLQSGPKSFSLSRIDFSEYSQMIDQGSKLFSNSYQYDEKNLPVIFCGIFINILVVLYFVNSKITRREKILSFAVLALYLFSFTVALPNLVWHAFNYPNCWPDRFSYTFCLFFILMAQRCFSNRDGLSRKSFTLCSIVIIGLFFVYGTLEYSYLSLASLYYDLILSFLFLYLISLMIKTETRGYSLPYIWVLLFIGIGSNLVINANDIYNQIYQGHIFSEKEYEKYDFGLRQTIDQVKQADNGFFRMDNTEPYTKNEAYQFSFNGITTYQAFIDQKAQGLINKFGYRMAAVSTRYGFGSTVGTDSFLGIKYLFNQSGNLNKPYPQVLKTTDHFVFQNPYVLPVGFAVSERMLVSEIDTYDPFLMMNNLYNDSVENYENVIYKKAEISATSYNNVRYDERLGKNYYFIQDEEQEASIVWQIKPQENRMLYANFPTIDFTDAELYVNDQFITECLDVSLKAHSIIPIGKFQDGGTIPVKMVLKKPYVVFREALFYFEDISVLQERTEALNESGADLQKITSSHLKGTIDVISDHRYLFFTIPYSTGWKIWIDDQITEATEVVDHLMAVPVSVGNHTIELRYTPPGFVAGSIISCISLIFFLVFLLIQKKKTLA